MKVAQVNHHDYTGGAARAAARLHLGLRAVGVESEMIVRDQSESFAGTRLFVPSSRVSDRLRRVAHRKTVGRGRQLFRPADKFEIFSTDRDPLGAELVRWLAGYNVVNLHWIHRLLEYGSFFRAIRGRVPIVWTLHDMNAFTGGCHYSKGCDRFTSRCGQCPRLGSSTENDLSRKIWRRKQTAFNHLPEGQLTFVTPSRWLGEECRRASLTKRFDVRVIPNGLDLETYQPRDPSPIRRIAGIPESAFVVLTLAASFTAARKGGRYIDELIQALSNREDLYFLIMGEAQPEIRGLPRVKSLKPNDDDCFLSFVYSAADLFFIPSLQDNLPNTVMESIACGTPVVGFDVGGIPDMVRPGISGELVPVGDVTASVAAIEALARDRDRLGCLSHSSRELAEREYGLTKQANAYRALYEEMLARKRTAVPQ